VRSQRLLAIIIFSAVVTRLLVALYMGDEITNLPGIYDQISYDMLAQSLAAGEGFSFPRAWWPNTPAHTQTSFWSFVYTGYLAMIYAVFGHRPLVARLIQALVAGVLHPWLAWRIGRKLLSPPRGRVSGLRSNWRKNRLPSPPEGRGDGGEGGPSVALAAALTAVYAYFIYYAVALITETFYILAILWTLDLAMQISEPKDRQINKPGWAGTGKWLQLGLALGIAVLLRQAILLFVPFLLTWLWWTARNPQHETRNTQYATGTLCALLVLAALILPWTARNYRVFGRFVLLNTNAGFAFFWANHPIHGTNFIPVLPTSGPSYQSLIPPELRGLDEATLDQALLREGLRFVVKDPLRYAFLSLSRAKEYFKFWPSPQSSLVSNIARVGSFGLCLPLMLYGLWLSAVGRRKSQPSTVTLLWLFVAVYTAIHLLSWALIRYRLPVDAVLLIFAGSAVAHLWERLAQRRKRDTETRGQGDEPIGN
jgi:hypothetical protein